MSQREVEQNLANMSGTTRIMAKLMYGAGLLISECVTLCLKDIDFDLWSITVRASKGNKDRTTLLPQALVTDLRNHLLKVYQLHKSDLLQGNGYTPMPNALYKKYPSASRSFGWQFVFPSTVVRPWHGTPHLQHCEKLFNKLQETRALPMHVGPLTLRHSFTSHLLAAGKDIRTIRKLLGHKNIEITMIYTHIQPDYNHVSSPLNHILRD
jgi:site-specific recombinase XerD